MDPVVKPCFVRLKDVGAKKNVTLPNVKLTKEQKQLLLPTKKSKKPAANGPKRGKKSGGKFQMKISGFFSTPTKIKEIKEEDGEEEEEINKKGGKEKENRASPHSDSDSSKTSRANTLEKATEEEIQDVDEGLEADVQKEKAKFLDDLDVPDEEPLSSSEEEESEDEWNGDEHTAFKNKKPVVRKPAAKGKKRKANMLAPIVIPGAMISELAMSDYEKIRAGNIMDREQLLAKIMADFNQYKQENGLVKKTANEPPKKRRKTAADGSFQSAARAPLTRRKSSRLTVEEKKETFGSIEWMTPEGERRKKLAEEDSDYNEDDAKPQRKRISQPKRWAFDPNVNVLMPEDVTPEMIANISFSSTGKVYDTVRGTTCHQCRQKTMDQKTICRSRDCSGVRGMFCGRCLQNRYGEEAEDALMNPTWSCPPCRGFCNCSICRNRDGKGATGILIHLAMDKGFNNVKDYLLSLQNSNVTDEYEE